MSFLERFKGKISSISKEGEIQTGGKQPELPRHIGEVKIGGWTGKARDSLDLSASNIETKVHKRVNSSFSEDNEMKPGIYKQSGNFNSYPLQSNNIVQKKPGRVPEMTMYTLNVLLANPYTYASPVVPTAPYQQLLYQSNAYNSPYPQPCAPPQIKNLRAGSTLENQSMQIDRKHLRNVAYQQLEKPFKPSEPFCEPNKESSDFCPPVFQIPHKTHIQIPKLPQNIPSSTAYFPGMSSAHLPQETSIQKRSSSLSAGTNRRRGTYKPYTLKEYKEKVPPKYYFLGGLGPNIGTEDWKNRKSKEERRIEFARSAQQINSIRFTQSLSLQPFIHSALLPEQEIALRMKEKMNEYSQKVRHSKRYFSLNKLAHSSIRNQSFVNYPY